MKCLFAIVFISIVLVECIHATPMWAQRKEGALSNWEPVFQDDPYVPMENNDEVGSVQPIRGNPPLTWAIHPIFRAVFSRVS